MTLQANQTAVKISSREALVFSRWLQRQSARATLLTADQKPQRRNAVQRVSKALARSGIRKRKARLFWFKIFKDDALVVTSVVDGQIARLRASQDRQGDITQFPLKIPTEVLDVHNRIRKVLNSRRGRRPLSTQDRKDRISGEINVVDRQIKRLRAQQKKSEIWKAEIASRRALGKTLLTDRKPT